MKPEFKISCPGLQELPGAADKVIAFAREHEVSVWLLDGEMGAGKTTLSKELCKKLGVEDVVQSPTFSIVNEYRTLEGEAVYHFDFYRIRDVEEAVQIGVEEYFYSGSVCLIEWPWKVEPLLPDVFLHIQIEVEKQSARKIHLTINE